MRIVTLFVLVGALYGCGGNRQLTPTASYGAEFEVPTMVSTMTETPVVAVVVVSTVVAVVVVVECYYSNYQRC